MEGKSEFDLISEPEMTRQLQRLKEHRKIADEDFHFTISDMAFLTGWTENYLRILERKGRIPASFRDDTIRGFGFRKGPGGKLIADKESGHGRRYWDAKGARAIIFFAMAQQAKNPAT